MEVDMRRELLQHLADQTDSFCSIEDLLLQERGPRENPILDKKPGKQLHLRRGKILLNERGKGGVDATEHAQLV
jgi:hypothetical protein